MNFHDKYLKYKIKYLNMMGGGGGGEKKMILCMKMN